MYKYKIARHDEVDGYDIEMYHCINFSQTEFEYMFRNAMQPAINAYLLTQDLCWHIDEEISTQPILHEYDANSKRYIRTSFDVATLTQIVADYLVKHGGFQYINKISASIGFDSSQWIDSITRDGSTAVDYGYIDESDITRNSITLLSVLDNLKLTLPIHPPHSMTLMEFMAFYHDEPTNVHEFADVCIRYEVYKEKYGDNTSAEGQ